MAEIDSSYPCPKCGAYQLVYDGVLLWRSGPRPPRELARTDVGFSPRADVERERCYHCASCGAEFFQDVEQRSAHLYAEGGGGQYVYSGVHGWQVRRFDGGKWIVEAVKDKEGKLFKRHKDI
jgi:hypothetical protein